LQGEEKEGHTSLPLPLNTFEEDGRLLEASGRAKHKSSKHRVVEPLAFFFFFTMIILLPLGIVFALSGVHRQLWAMIDPVFSDVSQCNQGFVDKSIRPGEIADFCFRPLSSIGGYWEASNVSFVPVNESLGVWGGIDSKCSGGFNKNAAESLMFVYAKFQIPNDPNLEDKTVDGTLKISLRYPYIAKHGGPIEYYDWDQKYMEKSLSIKILTAEESETLNKFESLCFNTLAFCFIGGIASIPLFLIFATKLADYQKARNAQYVHVPSRTLQSNNK
jgi:hypothetical protein